MSELLDRIQREIRERLEASRAAVHEHERLEAALHALGDAGSRATRAVRGSRRSSTAPARPPSAPAKPSGPRARPGTQPPAPAGAAEGGAPARRASGASAKAGRPARPAAPARKRAARGANREAVLGVVSERPGVTARELASASGVTGGTLYSLLRTLTQKGVLEKRELPGGQTGYVVAAGAPAGAGAPPKQGRARSTRAGGARAADTAGQATEQPADAPAEAPETPPHQAAS